MQDLEILAVAKTYTKETVIGMGALKGAPCTVQGVVDNGDGTQTLTLKWTDTTGTAHTTDIILPTSIFKITSPTNGQTLRYNSTSGMFENSNVSFSADLGDLDDVVLTSVQNGQVLTYDAANNRWINADGSTVASMEDLTDVTISTIQNGQILSYDSTSNKWVNISLADVATSGEASDVSYDNSTSGLAATEAQAAIDELADEKVDKETGKGLSANDFTNALKTKLDGIEDGAEVNKIDTVKVNGTALMPDADKAVNIEEKISKLSDVDLTDLADGMILIYDATNNKWYAGANTGASYTAGEGIEIDQNNVISSKIVLFTGTEAQWNSLPLADKIKFTHYATNDDQTGQIDPVPTQNSANLMTSGGIWSAIQDFISKVTGATANNFAALDASGNVIDSGKKAADFADRVASATANNFAGLDANGNLQDSGKKASDFADRVTGATANNFAGLDSNGNLQDSGKKAADFATPTDIDDIYKANSILGAKNLNKFPYKNGGAGDVWETNGITYTVNADGSVTANGTATADAYFRCGISTDDSNPITLYNGQKYILNGTGQERISVRLRNSNNSGVANATTEPTVYECDATGSYYVLLEVPNGETVDNLRIYPMLRFAQDDDATYQPYAKSNKVLTDNIKSIYEDNGRLGAKNLLPTPYYATKGGTTTSGTLTATENADGSVTINGTATGQSYIDLARNDKFLKAGTYILSGGLTSKQYVYINCLNNGTYIKTLVSAMTSEAKFVLDYNGYDAITVGISIASGEALSNTTFYPMIRLADDVDPTYQPYAMTNRELTNGGYSILSATANTDIIDLNNLTFIKSVKVVNATGYFHTQVAAAKNDLLYTFDEKIKTGDVRYKPYVLAANNSGSTFLLRVDENGIYIDNNDGIPVGNYAIIGGIFVQ